MDAPVSLIVAQKRVRVGLAFIAMLSLVAIAGCETLGYYSQAAGGQINLLRQRQSVDQVIAELDQREQSSEVVSLRNNLRLSQEILDFAETELDLSAGQNYRSYVQLNEPYVVWNLFAAPALSLEAKTWCYPIVGCAPYRGYFDRQTAERFQAKLETQGLDTYLAGVAAYSTLGWFDDPLLSSFVSWPETELAELLLHELAHSKVWVKDDAPFNEAFASFVGQSGMRLWLVQQSPAARGQTQLLEAYQLRKQARQVLLAVLKQTRSSLGEVYDSARSEPRKLAIKQELLDAAAQCYRDSAPSEYRDRYAGFLEGLNNAYLVSTSTYTDSIPAFAALFAAAHEDWPAFYLAVEAVGNLPFEQRQTELHRLAEQQITANGNDESAEDVQCQTFPGHGFDAEITRAVHDDIGGGGHR